MSTWEFDHLGRAVRKAREGDGVSQRELARRAGLSPSVVSRIEAGIVRQPDYRTLDRIAAALGRSAKALDYLSGQEHWALAFGDVLEHIPWEHEALSEFHYESPEELTALNEKWQERVLDAVVDYFVRSTIGASLSNHTLADEVREALERIGLRLPGLTDRRRALLLDFVDDQLALSELDRLAAERAERAGANGAGPERADD